MAVTQDDLREWARAFYDSLHGEKRLSLLQHMAEAAEQVSNEELRAALNDVYNIVAEGNSLSGAMAGHPDVFDKNFITIVRYGEIYGEVDVTLLRFAEHPEDLAPKCRVPAAS